MRLPQLRTARLAVLPLALAVALAGCGDDETSEPATTGSTTSTSTTTASTTTAEETTTPTSEPAGSSSGAPTAKDVAACIDGKEGAKATDEDLDPDVNVPRLELDAGVPPTGGAPTTGEVTIEFNAAFINLVFFDDPADAEAAIKLVEEEEDIKAQEGRLGTVGTVLYYVTFSNPEPAELDAVNACLEEAGGDSIPASS